MSLVIYGVGVDRHTQKTHPNKSYLKQPGIHRMPRFKIIHVCMLHMRLLRNSIQPESATEREQTSQRNKLKS